MQTVRLLQTVALMLVIALAASCAASKEYSSKLFPARNSLAGNTDSNRTVLRFLDMDTTAEERGNWVSTDIIMGRDSSNSTAALDQFSRIYPATAKKDSLDQSPVKDSTGHRSAPLLTGTKTADSGPVAKSYDPAGVRTKRTREDK